MINTRQALISALKNYKSDFDEEQEFCGQFITLLQHPQSYHRSHLPGHITGSAWIIDESHEYVLLTHHAKLNKWLQPGGHADGDENIYRVALREAEEETGLKDFKLANDGLFDIDIHIIPARKEFPEHLHYDIRFMFETSKDIALQITEESNDLQWVLLKDLENFSDNHSLLRMKQKTLSY